MDYRDLLNWAAISRLFYNGKSGVLRKNDIPKNKQVAVKELTDYVEYWLNKHFNIDQMEVIKEIKLSKGTLCIYKDAKGEFRWRLKHSNGNVVGASTEGYKNLDDCEGNIVLASEMMNEAYLLDNNLLNSKSLEEE